MKRSFVSDGRVLINLRSFAFIRGSDLSSLPAALAAAHPKLKRAPPPVHFYMEVEQPSSYEVLPPEARRRGQHCAIMNALAFHLTGIMAAGSVYTLFLLTLGAEAYLVGLAITFTQISPIVQLAGLRVMHRLGKARTLTAGYLVAVAPVVLLACISLFGKPGDAAIWLAVGCIALYTLALQFGLTGWMPLLQDVSAGDAMGAFFTRMRTLYQAAGAVAALAVGVYLGREPAPSRFALTFALAAAIMLFGIWHVRQIPERPVSNRSPHLMRRLWHAAGISPVRRFLAYNSLLNFVTFMALPFWIVFLKRRGLPDGFIVVLITAASIGNAAGVRLWGWLVDSYDYRPVLTIALLGQFLMGISWLGMPLPGSLLYVWAVVFYLIWGAGEAGSLMGQTRAMFSAVPASCQVDAFTLITLCRSACAALGAFIGGRIFQILLSETQPVIHPERWIALLHIGFLAAWLSAQRLAGYADQPSAASVFSDAFKRSARQRV